MSDPTDPKNTPEKAPGTVTTLRAGTFKPGHDPRRTGSQTAVKRGFAASLRAGTQDLKHQTAVMVAWSHGKDENGSPLPEEHKYRLQEVAIKWIADRALGKAPETLDLNVDKAENPLEQLTVEELRALAKAGK